MLYERLRGEPRLVEAVQWTGKNPAKVDLFTMGTQRRAVLSDGETQLELRLGANRNHLTFVPYDTWIVRRPHDPSVLWLEDNEDFREGYRPSKERHVYTPETSRSASSPASGEG